MANKPKIRIILLLNLGIIGFFLIGSYIIFPIANISSELPISPSQAYTECEFVNSSYWGTDENDWSIRTFSVGNAIYVCGGIFFNSQADLFLNKFDINGSLLWARRWATPAWECAYDVWANENFVYVTGYCGDYGGTYEDILVIKWDADGNQIWNFTIPRYESDYGFGITGDASNLYVAARVYGNHKYIMKYDFNGTQIWNVSRIFGDSTQGVKISVTDDAIYATSSYPAMVLVKYDRDGNFLWEKTYAPNYCTDIWVNDTTIYLLGITQVAATFNMTLVKCDLDGNVLSNGSWGTTNIEYSNRIFIQNNTIYTSGRQEIGGNSDVLLVQWDIDCNFQTYRTWGGPQYEASAGIHGNSTMIWILGETTSYGAGQRDILYTQWAILPANLPTTTSSSSSTTSTTSSSSSSSTTTVESSISTPTTTSRTTNYIYGNLFVDNVWYFIIGGIALTVLLVIAKLKRDAYF
jgi:hypothetical protein